MKWISVKDRLPDYNESVVAVNIDEPEEIVITQRSRRNDHGRDKNDFETRAVFEYADYWAKVEDKDWISVKDELPDCEIPVVIKSNCKTMVFGHRTKNYAVVTDENDFAVFEPNERVAYWAKLPEVPKTRNYERKH